MNRIESFFKYELYYPVKYGLQRMFRGYDDTEVFDFNLVFIKKFTKILTKIKDDNVFIFRNVDTGEYMSDKEQEKFLNHWIDLLKNSDENELYEHEFQDKKYDFKNDCQCCDEATQNRHEALELFAKYFDQLWE